MTLVTELPPRGRARTWVDAYWSRPASGSEAAQRVLPDGCADVIFSIERGTAMAVGTMTTALDLREDRAPAYFGVRFRPGRARRILGMPLHELTDRSVAFDDRVLAEGVAAARTDPARIAVIEEWLERRAGEPDTRLDRAVALLEAGRAVDDVAREVNLSRQHLRRRFLEHVGIGPKSFARVARFQRLLARVRGPRVDWAAEALEAGYFDQSHLIADFRELAGTTPVPFFLSA